MKDFANKGIKKTKKNTKKFVFRSKKISSLKISRKTLFFIFSISTVLVVISFFYLDTNVSKLESEESFNSIEISFPSSLIKGDSILIGPEDSAAYLSCEYFVQIGAYGNKKYALEAQDMLHNEINNISINEVYSTALPGKLIHSVVSGPYENKSSANNAKENITRKGFDPQLKATCK